MELKENTILKNGDYRIINTLGQGGFGITYLATQRGLDRTVVIKEFFMSDYCARERDTLRVTFGTDSSREMIERFREKFVKEARNIAAFDHPNIVRVIDVFEENNTAYYVMEYHSAGPLGSLVDNRDALNEDDALYYIRQVASALKYVHSRKMMHLDIKPDNILVNSSGEAVLIDFGLSKRYDEKGKATSTTPIGISHGYAPMEQYNPGGVGEFSPAIDIYSLGATLFTLLTGEMPPPALQLVDSRSLQGDLAAKNVSGAVAEAVIKSMSFMKEARPQSVDEFLALLDAQPATGSSSRPTQPMNNNGAATADNEPKKPFNWKIPVGIVVAILCVVFAINNYNDERAEQERLATVDAAKYYNDGVKAYNAKNYTEAARLYRIAAEQGHADAQCYLGYCYGKGLGVEKDPKEAVKWYRKAAEQGQSDAQYNLGYCYEKGLGVEKDPKEAVKWYRKAAEQGYADAQNYLGYCYVKGLGVAKDPTEAVKWYRKAAEQGYADAQCNLGYCYVKGSGVAKDPTEAVKWYRKAAEQGDAWAQYNLGLCYEIGIGVAKDPTEAVKWYRKAAEQGDAWAQCNLGYCYGTGSGVEKDPTEAVKWYRKAAEQGQVNAQYNLGLCYEIGVAKDLAEAVKWYRKAAEQGHADAKAALQRLNKK